MPPECIFPEQKDSPAGTDCRRNLIAVPSCDEHNLHKSGDDEYFMYVLCMNLPANAVARLQCETKLARAVARRPGLALSMLNDTEDVQVTDSHSGDVHDAVAVALDGVRFIRALDLVALGIYRHHFGTTWQGKLRSHADFIDWLDAPNPASVAADRLQAFAAAQALFSPVAKLGENPDVFSYQVHEEPNSGVCVIRLHFFGGCTATAILGEVS